MVREAKKKECGLMPLWKMLLPIPITGDGDMQQNV